jgi:hypothetical protein
MHCAGTCCVGVRCPLTCTLDNRVPGDRFLLLHHVVCLHLPICRLRCRFSFTHTQVTAGADTLDAGDVSRRQLCPKPHRLPLNLHTFELLCAADSRAHRCPLAFQCLNSVLPHSQLLRQPRCYRHACLCVSLPRGCGGGSSALPPGQRSRLGNCFVQSSTTHTHTHITHSNTAHSTAACLPDCNNCAHMSHARNTAVGQAVGLLMESKLDEPILHEVRCC